ncbi:MAG: iron-containing redox enzyme family protein [Mesorhizobium sp.]|uniref:iron-containing redox enzyme family protein n=1 Tax=Mesorhizobium sp. TaxID=1871066 RepID=UPI000FE9F366|nr:iron-containing redox enzyme family protein [Mesorhizobium sp.]RWQ45669.1 MAG: iron-containing redox enzyme family protein [Mesorhizobium sp.]
MPNEGELMRDFIDRWRDIAILELAHETRSVAGKEVVWWLNKANATTEDFMSALAGDTNFVVPGRPNESRFLTSFLNPSRPMGARLAADRKLVEDWIVAGAPIPTTMFSLSEKSLVRKTIPYKPEMTPEELLVNEPSYFHQLINIEDYPDFLDDAKVLTQHYLDEGSKQSLKGSEYGPLDDFNIYDPDEFDVRMKAIYDNLLISMYSTHWNDTGILRFRDQSGKVRNFPIGRLSDACPRQGMLQGAPFNLIDGGWLQNIITVGPANKIQANLFAIWDDEAGNGVVSQNHPNVYDALLKSQNIYLPPITTQEFIEQDFLRGSFTSPVFELAIGRFPQAFFPELLGMTLYLEWEATPTLTPTVRMYAGRGFNPLFYQLHVAIDNISEGHGALAKEAVKLYLENVREEGGDKAVQEHWARIRNGYITWLTTGTLGVALIERFLMIERKQINISGDPAKQLCWPDVKGYYRRQMIRLIEKKAPYARDVHRGKSIGGRALSELFDDPEALLSALVRYKYVDIESPRSSRLLELMEFNGPMYKVFTERDKDVVLDWIESISYKQRPCIEPLPDDTQPGDLPDQVAKIISDKAAAAMTAHDSFMMTGKDGKEVAFNTLFGDPVEVMRILRSNGWVVPSEPDRSMILSRIIRNGGPMDRVFTDAEEEIIRAWIAAGALLPGEGPKLPEWLSTLDPRDAKRLENALAAAGRRGWPLRHLIGMGSVH